MNDPKRWLEEGATSEERELLEAGRTAAMPGGLREKVWLGVSASAAALSVAGQAAGATALGAAHDATAVLGAAATGQGVMAAWVGSAAAKGVIAVAIVGAVGFGVVTVARAPTAEAPYDDVAQAAGDRAADRVESRAANSALASSGGDILDSPVHAPPIATAGQGTKGPGASARRSSVRLAPKGAPPSDETAAPRESPIEARATSHLREESAGVLAIRKTLLGGDSVEALRMIDRARSDFPGGALEEEREALAVRALVASRQNEAARQRGSAFLHAYPKSPHVSEVRTLTGL